LSLLGCAAIDRSSLQATGGSGGVNSAAGSANAGASSSPSGGTDSGGIAASMGGIADSGTSGSNSGGGTRSTGSSGSSAGGSASASAPDGGSDAIGEGGAPTVGDPFSGTQILTGLDDGYYTLSASVTKSGAGNCYISVKDYGGGPERMTSLPVTALPMTIVTRGVQVVGGQATIGFYQDADATDCVAGSAEFTRDDIPYQFLKGGDTTEVTRTEASGAVYRETDGTPTDPFVILKNHGYNIARLRLYNDPGNPDFSPSNQMPPYAGPADILALAKRAKAQGMMIELTFHYSDYWTNAGTQCLPHDWADLTTFSDVMAAMASFTQDFMTQMAEQDTTPEYVSIGNETNAGLLYPFGCAYVLQASPYCPTEKCTTANWSELGQLYGAAYDAVKAVSPSTQVIIHLAYDNGSSPAAASSDFNAYFSQIAANGGRYDIKGLTYYPFWSRQKVSDLVSMVNLATAAADSKPMIIMESGYNWNPTRQDGTLGQLTNDGPETYPSTPEGQKDFLLELYAGIKNVNGGRCIGDLYWDPMNIITDSQVSNTAMFDFSGNALPALDAAQFNN
jgi:arabinogalactan endo-1,4-beta-galactosidase